jgi:site-specific DNA-methyltransferase (adenine-specific)
MPKPLTQNTLFYGDNLPILREYILDESIDLIYLDPPFNSNRSYNVLFKDESGEEAEAQITAFEDTWHWGAETEKTYHEMIQNSPANVAQMIGALREFVGTNQMMAYLVMMAARLVELHRVLKPTGSLYLHCDPTASHYLKIILDTIFGLTNFRNEIIWKRTGSHNKIRRYAPVHDVILFYTKTNDFTWTYPKRPYMQGHVDENFVKDEIGYKTNYYGNVLTGSGTRNGESGKPWKGFDPTAKGRHWAIPGGLLEDLDEDLSELSQHQKLDRLFELGYIKIIDGQAWPIYERYIKPNDGQPIADILAYQPYTNGTVFGTDKGIDEDVRWLSPKDQERLGYPTQKPLALLERIIQASSNEGDVVLDPFCGCGTAIAAAQKLNRKWVGIDVTHLSISLMKYRMFDMFGLKEKQDFQVIGEPEDVSSAEQLAKDDRYQFQWWALSLVQAKPLGGESGSREGKKGSDKGIDGVINFINEKQKTERVIIQVKSGHVKSGDIRDLKGVLDREEAAIGVFITLEKPSKDMNTEAVSSGFYHSNLWQKDYPRIQILTIEDLLNGKSIDMPKSAPSQTFKQAEKVKKKDKEKQDKLL